MPGREGRVRRRSLPRIDPTCREIATFHLRWAGPATASEFAPLQVQLPGRSSPAEVPRPKFPGRSSLAEVPRPKFPGRGSLAEAPSADAPWPICSGPMPRQALDEGPAYTRDRLLEEPFAQRHIECPVDQHDLDALASCYRRRHLQASGPSLRAIGPAHWFGAGGAPGVRKADGATGSPMPKDPPQGSATRLHISVLSDEQQDGGLRAATERGNIDQVG